MNIAELESIANVLQNVITIIDDSLIAGFDDAEATAVDLQEAREQLDLAFRSLLAEIS